MSTVPPVIELEPTPTPEASIEAAAQVFKALSDPARLKILAYLASHDTGPCCGPKGGVCACDLEAVTGLSQPTVSHHMKCLISARLVIGEKRGKWMYYRIDPKGFALLRAFLPRIGG
ncbi:MULTISPECIES: helix-turn-helix transcriptional regulator [unclassified Meiothermus]|uniref:ArsR/SmtB family transcription factor n=1 Tax=unclassified Meiothermus TaxID=370471 RepID=UPI001F1F97C3|nr:MULTISPECIES: metalloregulator ArsR/SmtB family transcription factor [unclassified Meiothermus]